MLSTFSLKAFESNYSIVRSGNYFVKVANDGPKNGEIPDLNET
jgi:hypothetical protein